MAFTPSQYDVLERAVARSARVAITRRGSQWIVVAERLEVRSGSERLVTRHPSTGEAVTFEIDDIEQIEVVR